MDMCWKSRPLQTSYIGLLRTLHIIFYSDYVYPTAAPLPLEHVNKFYLIPVILLKMTQEISIHRTLSHKHIVGFESYFEDSDNVYIILELCRRRVSIIARPTLYVDSRRKWITTDKRFPG